MRFGFEFDRDRYLRRRRDRWQARPVRAGRRWNLGYFESHFAARRACRAFLACPDPLACPGLSPRYVYPTDADRYSVRVPGHAPVMAATLAAAVAVVEGTGLVGVELYSVPAKVPRRRTHAGQTVPA